MHGRVKVKTTEEQEKARREAKDQRLKVFRAATSTIFDNRRRQVYDTDTLHQIGEVLTKVPDWFTLWNYRREIIDHLKPERSTEEFTKLLNGELELTKMCLLENPKSYGTWHHRCWTMLNQPDPDWQRELDLCNYALSMDDRNFHCWDYRRFVVTEAGVTPAEELEFTTNKLMTNFSNYSSWHYRSTLLPKISTTEDGSIDETVLAEEFSLVHNAQYTDPSDQSPWFYHRWLLGRGSKKIYLRELYLSRQLNYLVLLFATPQPLTALEAMEVDVKLVRPHKEEVHLLQNLTSPSAETEGKDRELTWKSALDGNVSAVWWLVLPKEDLEDVTVEAKVKPDPTKEMVWNCSMQKGKGESLVRVELNPHRMFNLHIAVDSEDVLQEELTIVRELYELEPMNKWVLLTLISLLRCTKPSETLEEVLQVLEKLIEVDPLRTNYYNDLRSRYTVENKVITVYQNSLRDISLTYLDLTRVCCLDWMALLTTVDFSNNRVTVLPAECRYLLCVITLRLDNNQISDLTSLKGLPTLKELSVQNNAIETFEGLEPVLTCPRLKKLDIAGNKVADLEDLTARVANNPLSKNNSQSISILYERRV